MIAIVPIRSGSKGIINKNIQLLNGHPLVWWVLNSIEKSKVEKVIVATDFQYLELIKRFNFSKLELYLRDPKNSRDTSSTEDVLIEVINKLNIVDDIILVQATSPLTSFEDINRGLELYTNYDSVLSVVRQKRFIWNENGTPFNYDFRNRPRRQEFDGYYVENGAFYINHSENILLNKNRLSGNIGLYEMSEQTYYEIDSQEDWGIIESIMRNKMKK